ncbi:MAG: hypothetical protein HUN05_03515 [Desulfobacter sp.]|nr:MAG: hypothetical protein HUN05_03515 [Desulfobacter sp.]
MGKDRALEILAQSSVFEDEFSIDWVIELTGEKALKVLSALEFGCENHWIKNSNTGIFKFNDPEKQSQFLSGLSGSQSGILHARALEILSKELPDMPEKNSRLTTHLLKIKNQIQGCGLLVEEGDNQRKAWRFDRAQIFYDKALEDVSLLKGKQADELFIHITLKYAKIWTASQSYQRAKTTLKQALSKAKTLDDKTVLPLLRLNLAYQELFFGKYDTAQTQIEKGRQMIKNSEDPALIRSLKLFDMFLLYWQGLFTRAFAGYEAYIPAIETPPETRFDCFAKLIAGHASGLSGNISQGIGMIDAVHQHTTTLGDLGTASYASLTMGSLLGNLNRFEDAIVYYEQTLEEARASQSSRPRVYGLLSLGRRDLPGQDPGKKPKKP